MKILGIMWGNTTPSTELPRDFCAGIGSPQLGIVLVYLKLILQCHTDLHSLVQNDYKKKKVTFSAQQF